ncbi:hypothetical protein MTO96_049691 [Rhipicephalus appendiculatus]
MPPTALSLVVFPVERRASATPPFAPWPRGPMAPFKALVPNGPHRIVHWPGLFTRQLTLPIRCGRSPLSSKGPPQSSDKNTAPSSRTRDGRTERKGVLKERTTDSWEKRSAVPVVRCARGIHHSAQPTPRVSSTRQWSPTGGESRIVTNAATAATRARCVKLLAADTLCEV